MIYGIFHAKKDRRVSKDALFTLLPEALAERPTNSYFDQNVALATTETGVPTIDDGTSLAFASNKEIVVAASGNVFKHGSEYITHDSNVASLILSCYQNEGEAGFKALNGQVSAAICDKAKQKFVLLRDHLGFEPLFYSWDRDSLLFSSSLRSLLQHASKRELNFRAVRNYLLFNYNPGLDTFIANVKKVRPGHCLVFEQGKLQSRRYWFLSYENQNGRRIEDYTEELVTLTKDAIRIRSHENGSDPGAFLSGGMDSSSVVGLLSDLVDTPIHTFSFRCDDKYVDESHFARVMANHYKTQHNEIEFTAEELTNLERMAAWMEEPLCDIGVELGSYILGRAARGKVKYILTGDGGDELYAGHPVYIADKLATKFDHVPAPIRHAITRTARLLPDSEEKKSFRVKARRFAYSYNFPAELLSNRWRIYYTEDELSELCEPDVVAEFGELHSYDDITALYADADGPDALSRSLYGDYQTLVHFHVDRLRLTRAWGVEARFPLHDYRLIEFSATIPSELKIRGQQAKYVQKKAMEGLLPDEIVFRKDKMGHNVPMKNWMRNSVTFRELVNDVLSESALKRRGFFKTGVVQSMLELHLQKKRDYSHRLYALLLLELWMQKNLDA
ncbi:MAG: asparagine synthetase B family protein [bacterium]